jgi:DnaD/phage-associated family protein
MVIDDENLDAYDKATYGAICKYANVETGVCYPSLTTLAKKAGCGKKRVIKSINNLVNAGYIKKERRRGDNYENKSNLYKVIDLAYIKNALEYAQTKGKAELEQKIQERLQKHPIPDYEELNAIVAGQEDSSIPQQLGVVSQKHHPSISQTQELELQNYNYLNKEEEKENSLKKKFLEVFRQELVNYQLQRLKTFVDKLGLEVVLYGIEEAMLYGAKSFKYIIVMLKDWTSRGLNSLEKVKSFMDKPKGFGNQAKVRVNYGFTKVAKASTAVRGSNKFDSSKYESEGRAEISSDYFRKVKEMLMGVKGEKLAVQS